MDLFKVTGTLVKIHRYKTDLKPREQITKEKEYKKKSKKGY